MGALCHLRNTGAQRFQSLCVCLQEYLVADDILEELLGRAQELWGAFTVECMLVFRCPTAHVSLLV